MLRLVLVLLLLPSLALCQVKITGTVLNSADHKPIANASVFLSNATIGTKTADDGTFSLPNVRSGQYDLVVSVVGFDAFRQTVMVNATDIPLNNILLVPKTIELTEVKIRPGRDPAQDMATFMSEFLGTGEYAKQCVIENPEVIDLDYDPDTKTLTATSRDLLLITNNALGYKMKYLLTKFTKDEKAQLVYFEGSALFDDMDGTPTQKRRWSKRRKDVYDGSSMHFLRSVIANTTAADGFRIFKINRTYNMNFKAGGTEPRYNLSLDNRPLQLSDILGVSDKQGLFALACKSSVYIQYTRKKDFQQDFSGVNKVSYHSAYAGTALTINTPVATFDANGIITDPQDVVIEGYWGISRVAELLPVDYQPEGPNKGKKDQ